MEGRRDIWAKWLDEYGPRLALYARQWCTSHADAEELVQEAFVRFWRADRQHEEDPGNGLFWYLRQAAIDFYRSGKRRKEREALAGKARDTAEPVFDSTVERDEWRAAAEAALAALPLPQREVLVMKIWGGLTFARIADVMQISPNTAASRYRYALDTLRTRLMEKCDDGTRRF